MTIKTEQYEWSHGHKPRGLGLWMFEIRTRSGRETRTFSFTATYAEAKQAAVRYARQEGYDGYITVGA